MANRHEIEANEMYENNFILLQEKNFHTWGKFRINIFDDNNFISKACLELKLRIQTMVTKLKPIVITRITSNMIYFDKYKN